MQAKGEEGGREEAVVMNMRIHRDIAGEVESPVLLAGWPGMGSVGVGAINYLRRALDAQPFAEVDMSEYFTPEAVVVEDGIARFPELPSHRFYYVREPALVIFESEAQVSGQGGISLMNRILDLSEQLGVKTIYTGAAFAMPNSHQDPVEVLGVANSEPLRDALTPHGVKVLREGHVLGLNGLLLGFADLRGIQAACLLATMPQYAIQIPNPKASREIVQVMCRVLDLDIDISEMDGAVTQMSKMMAEIEEKIRTAFSSMDGENVEEGEFEEVDEDKVPQYVMEKIARLFQEVSVEMRLKGSTEKAGFLKQELDRWDLYGLYEDRFLNLFRQDPEANV